MSQPITSSAALKAFLLKLEIDEALADILIGKRITTIRKFTNMTTSFLDAVKEKATYTAIDNDINVIERFCLSMHIICKVPNNFLIMKVWTSQPLTLL